MKKRKLYFSTLITMTLTLTSCSYDAINSIDLYELPWEELAIRHFFEYPIFIAIIFIPLGLYTIYREIFRTPWTGKRIMKMKLKNFNFPFWFVLLGLAGLIWFTYDGLNSDIQFIIDSSLPEETKNGIILLWIMRALAILAVCLISGLYLILRLLRQPEIREKGIIHGLAFLPWQNISLAEWRGPGTLRIHYYWTRKLSLLFFWKKNKKQAKEEVKYYLEVKPEQESEINKHLQQFIPNRITGR